MTKTTIKSSTPSPAAEPDTDDDDLFDGADFPLPTLEEETIKRDSRRKIEIYWEKKRLREQLDEDFDDSDFDF